MKIISWIWMPALFVACGGSDATPVGPGDVDGSTEIQPGDADASSESDAGVEALEASSHDHAPSEPATDCSQVAPPCPAPCLSVLGQRIDAALGCAMAGGPIACVEPTSESDTVVSCVIRLGDGALFRVPQQWSGMDPSQWRACTPADPEFATATQAPDCE